MRYVQEGIGTIVGVLLLIPFMIVRGFWLGIQAAWSIVCEG